MEQWNYYPNIKDTRKLSDDNIQTKNLLTKYPSTIQKINIDKFLSLSDIKIFWNGYDRNNKIWNNEGIINRRDTNPH